MKIKLLPLILLSMLVFSCSKENVKPGTIDDNTEEIIAILEQEVETIEVVTEYSDYLLEYTAGIISADNPIKIRLNHENASITNIENIDLEKLLIVSGIDGITTMDENNYITFTPNNKFDSDSLIECIVDLSIAFPEISKELKQFNFNVRIIKLDFDIVLGDLLLSPGSKSNNYNYSATINFSDEVDPILVEKSFTAKLDGKDIKLKWIHNGATHNLSIHNIERSNKSRALELEFKGNKFNIKKDFKESIDILPLGVFSYLKHRVERGANSVIVINFTSTLLEKQNFTSLITVSGSRNFKTNVSGSQLKIYPKNPPKGEILVKINKALKDSARVNLGKDISLQVVLEKEYPEVKMLGSNGIVTGNKALFFPFEAVSLRAIDIRIIEVFENNLVQYLQNNKLAQGNKNLRTVAKPIYQGTVSLDVDDKNLLIWNRFHINLEDYIKVNPGSVYQVELSFRRSLSLYGDEKENEQLQDKMEDQKWAFPGTAKDSSYWDYYDDYNYNSNWQDRKNPNKDAYYSDPNKKKRRIVFSSNLGIIAKRSDYGDLRVFVTDINSAEFVKNADITAYNYQQQVIIKGKTDSEGIAILRMNGEVPFVISVDRGNDKGYLRLEDGSSLSISSFDTSGTKNRQGIKGFIYGERGVWRPGDTVFLHFILEDAEKKIPNGHPIVMTIKNPSGAIVDKIVNKKSNDPIYPFIFSTKEEDKTGNWSVEIQVGAVRFYKSIMIETVKPNRLKISLDFNSKELHKQSEPLIGNLKVDWLHGAPGKNLKAEFDVSYSSIPTIFKNYNDYIFHDSSKKLTKKTQNIYRGQVDEDGKDSISFSLNDNLQSPGKVKVNFAGKAYEDSGDFSIKNFSMPYSPYDTYIGLRVPKGDASRDMLLTDLKHKIDIVSLDAKGQPVSKDNLKVELFKIDWKWWWHQSAYSEVPNFVSSSSRSVVKSGTVNTTNGVGNWEFEIDYPSWGRYYLRVSDGKTGHSTGKVVYIDWPGWAGRSTEGNDGVARLLFSTDKEKYELGENIEVNFPSSAGGKALISIENGSDIVETRWVDTSRDSTNVTIKTTESFFPAAYIHITMLQPKNNKVNDRPLRLYGILPIKITSDLSILEPVIEMNDTLKPNRRVDINISEKSGKEMYYTLSVVDDGLLDLTNFITPNPYSNFFKREALGVKTWDIYSLIMGDSISDYGSLLAIGGGGGAKDENKEEVNRFRPVVKVFGPFKLKAGDEKTHSFTMPNYVGSVRTMVTAAAEGQYGAVEKTTPVKDPLMVLGTLPRVIGPNERVSLPVTVFAMNENIKDVKVTVRTEGLFEIKDEAIKTITFNDVGEQIVSFNLQTMDNLGASKIYIEATSGNYTNTYTIEIDVRPSNPIISKNEFSKISAKEVHKFNIEPWGYNDSRSMVLELSSMPPINLDKRLKYLIRYPHGCIEQTTSGVFPQLFISNLKDLTEEQKKNINKNIEAGINRLQQFTTSSGGLSYWPGESYPSEWGTTYAGNFLIEADRAGYNVPDDLLYNWAEYQKEQARNFNGGNTLIQAYRLYTLALYGEPEIGSMNRLFEKSNLSNQAKWRLAATYGLTGNKDAAEKLISGLNYSIDEYRSSSTTFGSSLRDKAMILETYGILEKDGYKLIKDISDILSSDKNLNTQATAYSLIAISKFNSSSNGVNASVKIDGKNIGISTQNGIYSEEIPYSENVEITNNSNGDLYSSIITEGIEKEGNETSKSNGLSLLTYYEFENDEVKETLSSGTNFKLKVKVRNQTAQLQEEVALSTIFPGGWEILNTRLTGEEKSEESSYEYKDIRDDRVYYYFDLTAGEEKTFIINLTATYAGEYYKPSIYAESMYNLDIKASKKGSWIEVVSSN